MVEVAVATEEIDAPADATNPGLTEISTLCEQGRYYRPHLRGICRRSFHAPDRAAAQCGGLPPPRSDKRHAQKIGKPAAWGADTITGHAARGTGILNNKLYVGRDPYQKRTYRKNPDTGRRHSFIRTDDNRPETVEVPELRIVSDVLWQHVKERQARLVHGPQPRKEGDPALPFFAQQRPRYLLTGKMARGASYAKAGKDRFGCQGSTKKKPTYCGNRVAIRQDELDGQARHRHRRDRHFEGHRCEPVRGRAEAVRSALSGA